MRLILFSGGVESTALLTLAKPDDIVLNVVAEGEPKTSSWRAIENIARHFDIRVERAYISSGGASEEGRSVYQLYWLTAVASLRVMQKPKITEVWYGLHAGEPHAGSVQEDFIALRKTWEAVHPNVKLMWPLYHLTKEQQWDLIPEEIRYMVRNCYYLNNCGTCKKCLELKSLSGSFWDYVSSVSD